MEPKFQSSFIPKGPVIGTGLSGSRSSTQRTLLGSIAMVIFGISLVLALGVFGYERYLIAHIATMGSDLDQARATLEPDTISELVRTNARINSTEELLKRHQSIAPIFDFLENTTLKSVRYTDFTFNNDKKGLVVSMKGQARGYSAVAEQSDAFNKSKLFRSPVFSNLDLDQKGNVTFVFDASLDPTMLSYEKYHQANSTLTPSTPVVLPVVAPVNTVTATSSNPSTSSGSSTKPK